MVPKHLLLLRHVFTMILIAFLMVLGSDLPGSVAPSQELKRCVRSAKSAVNENAPNSDRQSKTSSKFLASDSKTPAEWFREFDRIRRNADPTEQEKRDGSALLLRLAGGSNSPDNIELTKILRRMKKRYQIATKEIRNLPALNSDLTSLRDGYEGCFSASADLCDVCIDTATREVVDRERLCDLVEQKGLISELVIEFNRADAMVRAKYGVEKYDAGAARDSASIATKRRAAI